MLILGAAAATAIGVACGRDGSPSASPGTTNPASSGGGMGGAPPHAGGAGGGGAEAGHGGAAGMGGARATCTDDPAPGDAGACPPGFVRLTDVACDYFGGGEPADCHCVSDDVCRRACVDDADCTDPCRPFRVAPTMFRSTDSCEQNGPQRVCVAQRKYAIGCFEGPC